MTEKKKDFKCGAVHSNQKKLKCDLKKGHKGDHSGEAALFTNKKTRHPWK